MSFYLIKYKDEDFEHIGEFIGHYRNTLVFKTEKESFNCIFEDLLIEPMHINSIFNYLKNVKKIKIIRSISSYYFIQLPDSIKEKLIQEKYVYTTSFPKKQIFFKRNPENCKEIIKDQNERDLIDNIYQRKCNFNVGFFEFGDYMIQQKEYENSIIFLPVKHFTNSDLCCKKEENMFWITLFNLISMDPHIESLSMNFGYIQINFIEKSYPSCFFKDNDMIFQFLKEITILSKR